MSLHLPAPADCRQQDSQLVIPERVRTVLAANGLAAKEFAPGSTATSMLAAQQLGVQVGQIAKSFLFVGKDGRFFMMVSPGDRRISSSKLKAATGVKSSMASGDEALAATGFGPGAVCPFGVDGTILVFMDRSLSAYDMIYPSAGTDSSGVPMTFDVPVAITGGSAGDFLAEVAHE
jgi:prolyl-tRNA editing enzyme YbaK/EbsC (Cys-tRNA(Pro) deacylase)